MPCGAIHWQTVGTIRAQRRRGRFAGLSPDARRAERRQLLLDAAFDLLGTEGSAGTTVRAVCAAAELNPRYFYESFDNLDALVLAVYDRLTQTFGEALIAALDAAPSDVASQVRAGVECSVAFVDDDRRRARVLYVEAVANETLNARRVRAGRDLIAMIQEDARRRHRAAPLGDPIGPVTAAAIVGGMSEVLTAWTDGSIDVERERLIDDLGTLVMSLVETAGDIVARRAGRQSRAPATKRSPRRASS
jgi:AcrR family transcriptional regulator